MDLPEKGVEVPLAQIEAICRDYGLSDLWNKIKNDPPPKPFKSDGCSLWFDSWEGIDFYPASFFHDLKYGYGYSGKSPERLIADAELMVDIARAGAPKMAEIRFAEVRVGGHEDLKRSCSWGFGQQTD